MTKHPHDADVAFIQALAELLRENDLTELQVKRDYGEHDSLNVRSSREAPSSHMPCRQRPLPAPLRSPCRARRGSARGRGRPRANIRAPSPRPWSAPVYLPPEPGSAAFVKVGAQVAEGQTVLIIEAMKTMNQIPAPRAGTVKRILVEDGDAVEYGAPLMIIE
jgi:acetyl-CoA carboxylase biotin carboxyl carrier protein